MPRTTLSFLVLQRGAGTESNSFRAVRRIMTITFFHVWPRQPTEGIHWNSDSGTSRGAVRSSCHASIWLDDRMDRTALMNNSADSSQINHLLKTVGPFGHVGDFVVTVCESALMELRQHFLIIRNKHSREVEPPSAPNYCFTQMSDRPIWAVCCAILFGAHLPLSYTSHSRAYHGGLALLKRCIPRSRWSRI